MSEEEEKLFRQERKLSVKEVKLSGEEDHWVMKGLRDIERKTPFSKILC